MTNKGAIKVELDLLSLKMLSLLMFLEKKFSESCNDKQYPHLKATLELTCGTLLTGVRVPNVHWKKRWWRED